MRRISWIAAAVVVLASAAWAQDTSAPGAMEVTCPLDGFRFTPPTSQSDDHQGGMDSDGCWHSLASQPMAYLVIVCPRCNYTAWRGEFTVAIPAEKKPALLRMLAKSRYRGVVDTVASIPSWERFRLSAQCLETLGNPENRLPAVQFAAWCARVEACRPATLAAMMQAQATIAPVAGTARIAQQVPSTGIADVIREFEQKSAQAAKPEDKNRFDLQTAMLCDRAGFVAKRDAIVAKLQAAAPADPSLAGPLNRFVALLRIEGEFETQYAGLLRARVASEEGRDRRGLLTYVLADTLRRLGKDAEAVAEYRVARKMMPQPSEYRIFTDYFLTLLAPGEPLPTPEPPPAPAATDAGGAPESSTPAAPKTDNATK